MFEGFVISFRSLKELRMSDVLHPITDSIVLMGFIYLYTTSKQSWWGRVSPGRINSKSEKPFLPLSAVRIEPTNWLRVSVQILVFHAKLLGL